MFEGIKGLFPGRKKRINEVPNDDYEEGDLLLEQSSIPPTLGISLDPEEEYGENNVEQGASALATSFQEKEGPGPLLQKIAGWVSDLWAEYNNKAQDVIPQAIDYLRKTLPEYDEEETVLADGLRNRVKMTLDNKASRLAEVQRFLSSAREELRALKIGIFGSPERVVVLTDKITDFFISMGFMVASITIEFFLNFDVIKWATGSRVSASFSLAAGVVTSFAAHYAADAMRKKFAYADAVRENDRWSKKVGGIDPDTRNKIEKPFPLPASLSFQSKLSHCLWIGLCGVILAIRGAVVARRGNWGGMAGSIGFVSVVGLYYLIKVTRKGAAGVDEYLEKKKEIGEYEKELETLCDPVAEDSYTRRIMIAFSAYKKAAREKRPEGRKRAVAEAKAELIRLRNKSEGAREFFLGALQRSAQSFSDSVERLHGELADPSEEEIETMLIPPDPLAHANPAIDQALSEAETIPMTGASDINIDSLIREVWIGALDEQKRAAAEEAQRTAARQAANARKYISEFKPRGSK